MINAPLYVLPYGIQVIGEYKPSGKNRYWRVRIRPHRFFDVRVVSNGMRIRRSRVVMASKLGRKLLINELVHHENEDINNDSPGNLELMSAADHNKHHKTGGHHSKLSKQKISRTLKKAYATGSKVPVPSKGEKNGSAKLKTDQVLEIRKSDLPSRKLGAMYGVTKTTILAIKSNKIWRHIQ